MLYCHKTFLKVMSTDSCRTRTITGPEDENGIFFVNEFTFQEDQESVLVNSKRMRRVDVSLEVPIRVLNRKAAITKPTEKSTKNYQPPSSTANADLISLIASVEERPIPLNLNSESVQKQQIASSAMAASMETTHVTCTNCGGYHYTYCCPQKETYKRDIITEKGGIYVPPSKKNNVEKQTYSLKLDPVPHSWTRENLQKLVDDLCEELRVVLKNLQNEGTNKQTPAVKSFDQLHWREKVRLEKERKEALGRSNEPVQELQNQDDQAAAAADDKNEKPDPEPEDERIVSARAALAGLKLERASFPLNRIDGGKQGYAYINLGTKEAQQLFKARWDNAKIASEQIIMHVLLPEEYAPTRK
ncbi:Hypothetical protein GLP15_4487 [Giardia lamblia P15]|uniref:Eukaryotic translation initiation factor 3 subunit G N-terminal domain-containing protein n=1 Tax=Giardia intestinalis (strain P15) TaxID=658858 RepID=E1F815_GIAIA|nr:Hypothetical protein GLP15_4487 [Giardia lamblia P15]